MPSNGRKQTAEGGAQFALVVQAVVEIDHIRRPAGAEQRADGSAAEPGRRGPPARDDACAVQVEYVGAVRTTAQTRQALPAMAPAGRLTSRWSGQHTENAEGDEGRSSSSARACGMWLRAPARP